MKVRELIEKLQVVPQDLPVGVLDDVRGLCIPEVQIEHGDQFMPPHVFLAAGTDFPEELWPREGDAVRTGEWVLRCGEIRDDGTSHEWRRPAELRRAGPGEFFSANPPINEKCPECGNLVRTFQIIFTPISVGGSFQIIVPGS